MCYMPAHQLHLQAWLLLTGCTVEMWNKVKELVGLYEGFG